MDFNVKYKIFVADKDLVLVPSEVNVDDFDQIMIKAVEKYFNIIRINDIVNNENSNLFCNN